ncbi:MAG: DUF447 domain-containing protein [Planctomycetota bacterium]
MSTVAPNGAVNIAPMGPVLSHPEAMKDLKMDPGFTLRPFEGSTTCANLLASRRAVIHVTDDVLLFAKTAISSSSERSFDEVESLVYRINDGADAVLKDCHRWFAVEVDRVGGEGPRFELNCRLVASEVMRPFFGFNRAKHAIIEAAILATRTHLLDAEQIATQLRLLRPMVEKTAGHDETEAFQILLNSMQC